MVTKKLKLNAANIQDNKQKIQDTKNTQDTTNIQDTKNIHDTTHIHDTKKVTTNIQDTTNIHKKGYFVFKIVIKDFL